MTAKKRVLVIGAGPAGLAAGTRLLEKAPDRLAVRLIHMGHMVGGKAASYKDASDHTTEHGWHMLVGFYDEMRSLMRRAGIDVDKTLLSLKQQQHVYEPYNQRVHTIRSRGNRLRVAFDFLRFGGMPLGDRLNFGRVMSQSFFRAMSGEDLRRHDDICFRTWAVEQGLRPHITRYSLFRFFREAYFNYPESISAYHVLQSFRLMSTTEKAELFVVDGGYSERIWNPIAAYFKRLGGTIEPLTMATDWVYEGRRIVGVRVGMPDGRAHENDSRSWTTRQIPIKAGSERTLRDFDFVISTIPVAIVKRMNRSDTRMWRSPYFGRLANIRSASTISMTVLLDRPYLPYPGPLFGLPAPLGIVTNMKPYWAEYRNDARIGAALHFVGQEAGFEGWSDEQIVAFTLDNISKLRQLGDVRKAGIRRVEIHRNRSDFERIMLCEPGVQQFRPGPLTPFSNLFVAGDWVRNRVDLICMEGAITSGLEAAGEILERLGQ